MTKTNKPTIAELVVHIEELANAAYEKGGDTWIETMDVAEKEAFVVALGSGKQNYRSVAAAAKRFFKSAHQITEIGRENAACYDVEDYGDEAEQPKATKSVVPLEHKKRYGKSQSCGDDVAKRLKGLQPEDLAFLAQLNGIVYARWSHLNGGMQRMNLGNVIRGMEKRGEEVRYEA